MSEMLTAALDSAARGGPVFPVWGVADDGRCQCGVGGCENIGKHPVGYFVPNGFKSATTEEARAGGRAPARGQKKRPELNGARWKALEPPVTSASRARAQDAGACGLGAYGGPRDGRAGSVSRSAAAAAHVSSSPCAISPGPRHPESWAATPWWETV